jgi:RNA polymerase sigma factor (sigma-70 family)
MRAMTCAERTGDEQQIAPASAPHLHLLRENRDILNLAGDQDVLLAIVRGKMEALDVLYQRYHQGLYALAYRIVSDHQLAEDLVQETFVRVWRHAASYAPQAGSVRGWLFAILRNYAIDYLRKQRQRSTPREVPLGEIECEERVALEDTWEEVWRREERAQLGRALMRLSEKQRMVIELGYFQGYTHVEIAEMSGLPLGTVKSSMRLGLQAMKRELMKGGAQEAAC